MFTIRPNPRSVMLSTVLRHMLNTPSRLTCISSLHCAWLIFLSEVSRVMPAALTTMSTLPYFSVTCCTRLTQSSKCATSAGAKTMLPLYSRVSSRNAASRSCLLPRSAATTCRPSSASRLQMAVPSPPMPPVTTATRLVIEYLREMPHSVTCCAAAITRWYEPANGVSTALSGRLVRVGVGGGLRLLRLGFTARLQRSPQFDVEVGDLVQQRPGGLAQQVVQLVAELVLLFQENLEAVFEIPADEALHCVTVEPDDLREQGGREDRLAVLFVLGNDLQQHRPRQVFVRLGVANFEGLAGQHQLPHFFQRDVAGDAGVVQAAIRVFLDDARWCHAAKVARVAAAHQQGCICAIVPDRRVAQRMLAVTIPESRASQRPSLA